MGGRSDNGADIKETYDPIKVITTKRIRVQKDYIITILVEAIQGEKFFESYASRMPFVVKRKLWKAYSVYPQRQACKIAKVYPITARFTPMSESPKPLCILATYSCLARSSEALSA
jgi:hypothetical protein